MGSLNAAFLDWYFPEKVVLAELVQLQANWSISYHGEDRIVLDRNERGHTLLIVDSSRMNSFLMAQANRRRTRRMRSCAASRSATGYRPTTNPDPGGDPTLQIPMQKSFARRSHDVEAGEQACGA